MELSLSNKLSVRKRTFPTWGRILYDGRDYMDLAPYWVLFPGLAIFITVLTISFIGDGLRDALDPRRVM